MKYTLGIAAICPSELPELDGLEIAILYRTAIHGYTYSGRFRVRSRKTLQLSVVSDDLIICP